MRWGRRLLLAQWLTLALYVFLLLVPLVPVPTDVRDLLLANLVYLLPAAVMVTRGWAVPADRAWCWCLAAAVLSSWTGNLIYFVWVVPLDPEPYPSWADAAYLWALPFAMVAVLLSMRARGRLRGSVLLDGLAGGLAAATLASASFAVIPLARMGVLAANGGRLGSFYVYLATGLTILAVADVVYGYQIAYDTYVVGSPLDALWALSAALMAHAVWQPGSQREQPSVGLSSLWVIAVSGLIATSVLAASSRLDLPLVLIVLAVATLLASVARTVVAFARVRDMAAIRLQAMTDDLTGGQPPGAVRADRAQSGRAPPRPGRRPGVARPRPVVRDGDGVRPEGRRHRAVECRPRRCC